MRSALRTLPLLMLAAVMGCASANTPAGTASQRNVLTRDEITGINVSNLHEAIQRLRPQFMRGRGASGIRSNYDPSCNCYRPDMPVVYMDRVRVGDLDQLRTINVEQVQQVVYITGTDTGIQIGTNHPGGVIHVITRT